MNPFIIAAKHYLPTIVNITIKQGFYILFSCSVLLSACSQPIVTTIKVNNDSIFIGGDIHRTRFFHYCVEDIYMDSIPVFADTTLLVQSFLRPEMELAYNMAVKNGCIQIHFSVDQNDTTILYRCKCNKRHSFNTKIMGLDYSKIEHATSFKKNAPHIRKWLYHNGIGTNLDDTLVSKIIQYHYLLEYINNVVKQTDEAYFDKFIIEKEIPIISTKGNKLPTLSVTSDMIADCYYVFVASTSSELNTLIEWQCANNFEQRISKLPHKIQPYRNKQEDGVYCIFLVGINDDWTTQIDPIGLICIDNNAPSLSQNSISGFLSNRQFSDNSNIDHYVLTFNKPQILISYNSQQLPLYKGIATIQWGDFEGRGNIMRIPYTFSWSGDVRYIRIINEKKWDEFSYVVAPKIIQIDTHQHSSPYQTIFNTYLPNTGDNFLQVELEDNRGNISRHTINITTHRIDRGSSISINNSVYNNIH